MSAEIRDLDIEVLGGTYPDEYLYVGSGDHCVLLAEHNVPKWRNAVGLSPENARKLAAALNRMADQSEQVEPADDPLDLTRPAKPSDLTQAMSRRRGRW